MKPHAFHPLLDCPAVLIFLTCALAACFPTGGMSSFSTSTPPGAAPISAVIGSATPTITPTATTVASLAPTQPTPPALRVPIRTSYQLSAQLDYTQHSTLVQEQIIVSNSWDQPLPSLVLVVEANHYPGAFSLNSIGLHGADALPATSYTLQDHRLELRLPAPLVPGDTLRLDLNFHLALPAIPAPTDDRRPVPFGYTPRQTNLVDWYPYLAAYQPGTGWLLHAAWAFGEHEVYDAADYKVDLELLNPPTGLVVAASAPASQDGNHYHYTLDAGRAFAVSTSVQYILASQTVGATTVYAYTFPWDKTAGEAALRDTSSALELYNQLFGAYPHATLSVVEADFLDGMEYDGLYFLSRGFYNLYDGTPKGYLTAIAVHETAHQWWYGVVGDDQALEPWLDEAMATYAERLYYERIHPELSDWWWAFRIGFYNPQGWINLPIYDYGGFTLYRNAVYLRGASFLEDLRIRVGDEVFFAFLKDYAIQYAHKRATAQDFFALLHQHSPADLTPLLTIYFDQHK